MSWIDKINPFNLFKKKEEPEGAPYSYGIIRLTNVAKSMGLTDDENKVIDVFRGGERVECLPYTKSHLLALREVDEIPIVEEEFDEEDFEFESVVDFGILEHKK